MSDTGNSVPPPEQPATPPEQLAAPPEPPTAPPGETGAKKKRGPLAILRWVLIAVFAGVFLYSGLTLANYYWVSYNTQRDVTQLKKLLPESTPRPSPTPRPADYTPAPPVYEIEEEFVWKIDERFLPILELNDNVVGWITIDGTNIDYPVMQTDEREPEYYLNHNFDGGWDTLGLPFLDYRCSLMPSSDAMIVYGHNIRSKIMFHHLTDYEDIGFWRENQYVVFDTLFAEGTYQIFAAFRFNVGAADSRGFQFHRYADFETPEEFDDQIAQVKQAALYDTGITPKYGDRLLILATCEYSSWNSRFVLYAREVEYVLTGASRPD